MPQMSKPKFARLKNDKKHIERSDSKMTPLTLAEKVTEKLAMSRNGCLPTVLVRIIIDYYGSVIVDIARLSESYLAARTAFNESEIAEHIPSLQTQNHVMNSYGASLLRTLKTKGVRYNLWNTSSDDDTCTHFEILSVNEPENVTQQRRDAYAAADEDGPTLMDLEQGEAPNLFYSSLSTVRYLVNRAQQYNLITEETEMNAHAAITKIAIRNGITKPPAKSDQNEIWWWEACTPSVQPKWNPVDELADLNPRGRRHQQRQIEFVKWIEQLFQTLLDGERSGEIQCWVHDDKDDAQRRLRREAEMKRSWDAERAVMKEASELETDFHRNDQAGIRAEYEDDDDDDSMEYDVWICVKSGVDQHKCLFRIRLLLVVEECQGC